MSDKSRTRLNLVGPGDVLTGAAPTGFEKASKACQVGDRTHYGLLSICVAVARHGLRRVIAPSARMPLLKALTHVEDFSRGARSLKALKQARSDCFTALPQVIQGTLDALQASVPAPQAPPAGLMRHAQSLPWRYAGLAARLGTDAVLLTLDGVTQPSVLSDVVQQVAAARAYQATGLGAARQPALLDQASQQAAFESEHLPSSGHAAEALTLQVLHEYLGVRWKVLHDAERAYIDQFVEWALSGADFTGRA